MRSFFLILAWITPAFVAGALGWSGVWGAGSAFGDYLIPIPVAGGVMHVPTFLVATIVIFAESKQPEPHSGFVLFGALAVFLGALALQIDFDRLNEALFTDYEPYGSALRLEKSPFLLFVTTDAMWVAIYAFAVGCRVKPALLALLPLVPAAIVGSELFNYATGEPELTWGFSRPTTERGNEVGFVHTSGGYDEARFRAWIEDTNIVIMPWDTPNAENLAVLFTNSMQAIRWRKIENTATVVGTFCFYEEDQSSTAHAGYKDCFADRLTLSKRLNAAAEQIDTGFGREIDRWAANVKVCEGLEIPEERTLDIEHINFCRGVKGRYPELIANMATRYGSDSPEIEFIRSEAARIGITQN